MKKDEDLGLNAEQKNAIEYNKGPILIIAGAGTGKTHTIVEKIKYLIQKGLSRPEEILALTFTEKAAFEMEERVDKIIPYGYFQMWISTFHAFADQILKEEATHIGLTSGFRLLTEAETIIFLRKNLFLFDLKYFRPLGNPNKFLEALLKHFSRLKDEDIAPEEYIKWAQAQRSKLKDQIEIEKNIELANAYKTYQQLKIKEGLVDFADLVFYLVKLFRVRPNLLKKYQQQFTHVLVDEFQDTNIVQYELIKLLCLPQKNPKLTVVGDDSQSIYKFRGASISNILTFMHDYPKARQVTLRKNYRSNQEILDTAYRLIKHNDPDTLEAKLGISKNLIAQKENIKNSISFNFAGRAEDEADYVASEILKLQQKYRFSEMAVLARANNHADIFIRAFQQKGIPYQFLGPGMLFRQPEVKDLIAYLKVLYNVEDSVSLYRVLTMDIFSLDTKDISLLLSFSKRTNLFLFQAIEVCLSFFYKELFQKEFEIYRKYLPLIKEETRTKLFNVYKMIERHLTLMKKETAGTVLYFFLEETKYLNKLVAYKSEREEKIALNISKFFSKLKTFETEHEDASVPSLVDYIQMSMELGESPTASQIDLTAYNAVNILTVHSAKGLEFPVVFLVNLTRGRFPTYNKNDAIPIPTELIKEILPVGDYHMEEERRLFYVGLTRAMDKVFFTAANYYGEGKRQQKISPFVLETLGEDFIKKQETFKKEEKLQLSIFDFKKKEEVIQKAPLTINNFSFTQLETYEKCPLQYKYQYVLRIPTSPSAPLSFGDTIHKTLQKFYQEFVKDKSVDKKKLLEIFRQQWIPLGYASSAHERRMKKEGESMLINFLKTFHEKEIKVIDLEKLFRIKIAQDVFVTGKIDRVDGKEKDEIEIIDYKTGKTPDKKEIEKSLQLSIYAMAATDQGLYKKKLEEVHLTFYYLQDMEKISLKRTAKDMISVKEEIKKTAQEIRRGDFFPNVGPWCDFCSFRMICEAWQ